MSSSQSTTSTFLHSPKHKNTLLIPGGQPSVDEVRRLGWNWPLTCRAQLPACILTSWTMRREPCTSAMCSVCLHTCTYIFLCLRFGWFVCVLMFFWCMFAHVCDYTEKLDLPPVLQRDRGRAACYRRQITKQYWSGRGHALTNPVFGGFLQTLITSRRLPYPGLISH